MMRLLIVIAAVLAGCGVEQSFAPVPASTTSNLSPQYHTACTGSFTSQAGVRHVLAYNVYGQMDGSTLTTCSVNAGQAATLGLNLYRPDQEEGALSECYVHYDVSEPTFGSFTMLLVMGDGFAVYSDAGSAEDGTITPLTCTTR